MLREGFKKKNFQTLDIVQTSKTSPPIRGGLDSKSLDFMRLSWPPHPLGKFGHLGNKSLAIKKAFILLRLKTVCLYRQVELLVYTSTLHFRSSCENVTMNHFFKRHSLNLFWGVLKDFYSLFPFYQTHPFYHVSKGVKKQTFSQKLEGSD